MIRLAGAGAFVPGRAWIVILVIHAGKGLFPGRFSRVDQGLAVFASGVAGARRKLAEDLARDLGRIAANADADRLGQADAIRVDVHLNDLGRLGPIVDLVAWQGRKRIEPRAERQHHIGPGDQLHGRARAIVAQRPRRQGMAARKAVIVLIARTDRRIQPFGQSDAVWNGAAYHHPRPGQDHRELGFRQKPRRLGYGRRAARRALKLDDGGKIDIDDLGPEVARDVDLGRGRQTAGLEDNPVQHLGHARGVANLFLIADHVAEHGHLLDLLKTALAESLVGGLGRDHQHRGVVPVGGLHGGDKARHAGTVLGDDHAHLAAGAGVTVAHQPAIGLLRHVPEGDARLGEEVRNRHEGRADDAKGVGDAMALQHFDEGFFGGHLHRRRSRSHHSSAKMHSQWRRL